MESNFLKNKQIDIVIIDTAGRHKEEQSLLDEMKSMYSIVTPDHVFLIIDGTIGQQAFNQAKIFHENAKISGIIITKLMGLPKEVVQLQRRLLRVQRYCLLEQEKESTI